MKFTKMHGLGNDYIYFDGSKENIADPSALSVRLSDRHFSVGGDGIVIILPSEVADFRMRMFNADGSEGKMCGNATRCIGKYVYEKKLTDKTELTLETLSGIKKLALDVKNGKVVSVSVDMGRAEFSPEKIPVKFNVPGEVIDRPLEVDGKIWNVTCVSMGNPHCVTFVPDTAQLDLAKIGPMFENHAAFPERVNTEFVHVINPLMLEMRVWERGSGETMACGTGACATVAAAVRNGISPSGEFITVKLLGGDLSVQYQPDGTVIMRGSANFAFEGEVF